jgi:hypothetical protein
MFVLGPTLILWRSQKRPLPFHYNLLSESNGESQGYDTCNQLITLHNNGGEVGIRMQSLDLLQQLKNIKITNT